MQDMIVFTLKKDMEEVQKKVTHLEENKESENFPLFLQGIAREMYFLAAKYDSMAQRLEQENK